MDSALVLPNGSGRRCLVAPVRGRGEESGKDDWDVELSEKSASVKEEEKNEELRFGVSSERCKPTTSAYDPTHSVRRETPKASVQSHQPTSDHSTRDEQEPVQQGLFEVASSSGGIGGEATKGFPGECRHSPYLQGKNHPTQIK